MTNLFWTAKARMALSDAFDSIAESNPLVANGFLSAVDARTELLVDFPLIGTPLTSGRRKLSIGRYPYVLLYRAVPRGVIVLDIRHMARSTP